VSIEEFKVTLNKYGAERRPFLFLVDFEMQRPLVYPLDEVPEKDVLYDINGRTNAIPTPGRRRVGEFAKFPLAFSVYKEKFDTVWSRLVYGDSYLTNLTIKTEVKTSYSLRDIFFMSRAPYKVWFKDEFVVFSPETFVRIAGGTISSFPMKGTIDAALPNARQTILNDPKEMAEHVTIVDLIRNDLSTVADSVYVAQFRYIDEIRTIHKNLLQVSSRIEGRLGKGYEDRLGDIMVQLLPAGSVSGAPKPKTVAIIQAAEKEPRGYYTGVVGLYDGETLDSGVMIRFLEHQHGSLYYRSGGGITAQSRAETEYQEAIDKIYVPFD